MYQAITTKFLPCTNFKPSRVKATAEAGSVILSWDNELNSNQNHLVAAQTLANKFGWIGKWVGGSVPKSPCYVFVCDRSDPRDSFTIGDAT